MSEVDWKGGAPAPDMRPRARVWLFRLIATLLAVTTTLLLAEGGARVVARIMHKDRALVFDADLGWRPLPNLTKLGDYWGVTRPAKTNSHGWRDAEHTFEKPAGARRAVLLGDSFAFGLYVDDGDRLSDLLGKGEDHLEVVNMGVTAWGTDQELLALELEGFRYSPDLVILLVFPENDLDDIRRERNCSWPKPRFDLVDGKLELIKPALTWDIRLRSISYCAEFVYQQLRTKDSDERITESWKSRDTVPLFAAIVKRMAKECKARNVRPVAVIAYPPKRLATGPTEAEQRVRAALDEAGFVTCDTFETFKKHAAAGESLYAKGSDTFHWNARGNALAAEDVRKLLLDLGFVR